MGPYQNWGYDLWGLLGRDISFRTRETLLIVGWWCFFWNPNLLEDPFAGDGWFLFMGGLETLHADLC